LAPIDTVDDVARGAMGVSSARRDGLPRDPYIVVTPEPADREGTRGQARPEPPTWR